MTKESGMSKREQRRQQMKRASQRNRLITIGLIVAGALLVAFFLIWPNLQPVGTVSTPQDVITRSQVDDNSVGDPNAPIKIEEFSDFQCPYCARFVSQTEAQLVNAYVETGKAIARFYKKADMAKEEAEKAARFAAERAAEQR